MHACCSVSFILPPVQTIPWWQLTEVPQDAGPQFNFSFFCLWCRWRKGENNVTFKTKPCCIISFTEVRLVALFHGPWGRKPKCPSEFLALHGWFLWLPGRCGMRRIWALQGLLPLTWTHLQPLVAAGLSLRAAAFERREAGGGGRIQSSANEARFIWCCCSLNPWSLGGRGRGKDCI